MRKVFILVLILATFAISTVNADDAEWQFYGSVRMGTFYNDRDFGDLLSQPDAQIPLSDKDDGLEWSLISTSRIGGKVQKGPLTGHFEYGSGPNLRYLYGVWDFDTAQFLVGQTWTPLGSYFYSNQAYNNDDLLFKVGQVANLRHPMLQLTLGGFKMALVALHSATDLGTGGSVEINYPKLEITYHHDWDSGFLDLFGGYQIYEIIDSITELDVKAYAYGIGGGFAIGSGYLRGGFYISKNAGQYGLANVGMSDALVVDDRLIDNHTIGGLVVVGWKVSDFLTVEAGVGMTRHELQDYRFSKNENAAYYLQAPLTMAPGLRIIPEIGHYDFREDYQGLDAGDLTYMGAKWQVDF